MLYSKQEQAPLACPCHHSHSGPIYCTTLSTQTTIHEKPMSQMPQAPTRTLSRLFCLRSTHNSFGGPQPAVRGKGKRGLPVVPLPQTGVPDWVPHAPAENSVP